MLQIMKKFFASSLFAVALIALGNRTALALSVNVAEDASSTATHLITAATGKATSLPVNAKQTAFLRFALLDPTVVPPEINPTNITSATLRLYVVGTKPGDLTVHAVTAKWTELPLSKTGTAAPSISGATIDTILSAEVPGKHFITVDVTAAVKAAITGSTDYGFAIQTSGTAKVLLGSKEGPGSGVAAQLEIEANLSENASGNVTIPGTLAVSNAFTVESRPNSTGSSNVFIGINAGAADTTGFGNTFVGQNAGQSDTGGFSNSFYGWKAGASNTTGNFNVFLGQNAGGSNDSGANNSFVGQQAGFENVSGNYNTFFGFEAGLSNVSGNENTFFGVEAGLHNIASDNSFFGVAAGLGNTSGMKNSIFGYSAGSNLSTGSNNTLVGAVAGNSNSSESNNTLLGYLTTGNSGNANATAIGANASVTASNSLVLGSIIGVNGATADTSVGIGVTAPNSTLQVKGSLSLPVRTVTNPILANLTSSDYVLINLGTSAASIVLPGAVSGRVYVVKNKATVAATLGFSGSGPLIDGAATLSIPSNTVVQVICDGTNWFKIN